MNKLKLTQKGFHVLHIVPLIAIVMLIAVVGTKVYKQSFALTEIPTFSCSTTWTGHSSTRTIDYKYKYSLSPKANSTQFWTMQIYMDGTWSGGYHDNIKVKNVGVSIAPGEFKELTGTLGTFNSPASYAIWSVSSKQLTSTPTIVNCNSAKVYEY
jgi:hypothetical protein